MRKEDEEGEDERRIGPLGPAGHWEWSGPAGTAII